MMHFLPGPGCTAAQIEHHTVQANCFSPAITAAGNMKLAHTQLRHVGPNLAARSLHASPVRRYCRAMEYDDCPFPFRKVYDEPCLFCGGRAWVALAEVWADHSFQIATCCEGAHEDVLAGFHADPDYRAALLREIGAEAATGHQIRRVVCDDGLGYQADYELEMRPIRVDASNEFIVKHHKHVGSIKIARFRGAIWNGRTLLGVIVVGNPVARAYNHTGRLEVRRLCLDLSISDHLRWKACSFGYKWAAAEAERLGWDLVITYTLDIEDGMSLRYARWKPLGPASRAGKSWNTPARPRSTPVSQESSRAKVIWEKKLSPTREARAWRVAVEEKRRATRAAALARQIERKAMGDLLAVT